MSLDLVAATGPTQVEDELLGSSLTVTCVQCVHAEVPEDVSTGRSIMRGTTARIKMGSRRGRGMISPSIEGGVQPRSVETMPCLFRSLMTLRSPRSLDTYCSEK